MNRLLIALFLLLLPSLLIAHPGHGDLVHRVTGLDWSVAAGLLAIGVAMMVLARSLLPRLAGALVACGGLAFAASLV